MKNISLSELESLVTERVLCERLVDPVTNKRVYQFKYQTALELAMFTLDNLLVEKGLNRDFWARIRGKRLYLFYLPQRRIAMEVGVITDDSENDLRRRFRIEFIGYRGKFPPKTIADLISILEESNRKRNLNRSNYDRNHQRKIRQ